MANEKTPVVWDDTTKKHRPLGSGEKMGGLSASSMISSDSGNLLQQGSDGLMLVTGGSIADPRADNLLEESDNGKLQVTSDRVVEWLEGHPQAAAAIAEAVKVVSGDSGNVITAGTDKGAFMSKNTLASAVSTMTPAQLTTLANALRKSGGGLSVGSDGKLSVDFASMDPAIMQQVVLDMIDTEGGLAVYSSGAKRGKMYVDFENMPTDKFEKMMKDLKMLVPLSANLDLYVDASSDGDSLVNGRGTQAKPFKHIQNCINYFSSTYSLGGYHVTIHVAPGTYSESLSLGAFTYTSGYVLITASDSANPPVLTNPALGSTIMNVTGSGWRISRLSLQSSRRASNDGLEHHVYVLYLRNSAELTMTGCSLYDEYTGAAPSSGHTWLHTLAVELGSTLTFGTMKNYGNVIEVHKGSANGLTVITFTSSSNIRAYATNDDEAVVKIYVSGEFDRFLAGGSSAVLSIVTGAAHAQSFDVPSGKTATGQQYYVSTCAGLSLLSGQTVPGTADSGAVDSATYGWVKYN